MATSKYLFHSYLLKLKNFASLTDSISTGRAGSVAVTVVTTPRTPLPARTKPQVGMSPNNQVDELCLPSELTDSIFTGWAGSVAVTVVTVQQLQNYVLF